MKKQAGQPMRNGYRVHDHVTEWQECDTCHCRLGAGIMTRWDATYYADDHDPENCPVAGCDGRMGLPPVGRRGGYRV